MMDFIVYISRCIDIIDFVETVGTDGTKAGFHREKHMEYMKFTANLPLDRTIKFASAEENTETMKSWGVNQEVRQLGAGKFRADLAVRRVQDIELYADRFNKAVSVYLEPPAGTITFLFPRSVSGKFLACGQNVGNEKLIVIPDGSGVDIAVPELAGSEAVTISSARLTELSEVLTPTFIQPDGLRIVEGNLVQLHHLRQTLLYLVAHPESDVNNEQLSDLLATTIVWIAESSSQGSRSELVHAHTARARIAKLAQEYIEEHHNETIRMEDLCRVTSVGIRTLQRCFKEYFDLSISDYLKAVRLNTAHRELTVARPSEDSVTSIALRNGFTHLGRFSTEFHNFFGQPPSETLSTRSNQML